MSDDAKTAKELVETLKDGERGFADAAKKLGDGEHPKWATTLQRLSEQRAGFWREIVDLGDDYGDDVDKGGSVAAGLHRGWVSLKDALTGDDASAVLRRGVDRRGPRCLGVRGRPEAGPQRRLPRGRPAPADGSHRRARRGRGAPERRVTAPVSSPH